MKLLICYEHSYEYIFPLTNIPLFTAMISHRVYAFAFQKKWLWLLLNGKRDKWRKMDIRIYM
jgi:hypothetical protein